MLSGVALSSLPALVPFCREADRVILTTCQEKGAQLETFHAISQKLGNKTASEVRAAAELLLSAAVTGAGGRKGKRSFASPALNFDLMLHQGKIIPAGNQKLKPNPGACWCGQTNRTVVPEETAAPGAPPVPFLLEPCIKTCCGFNMEAQNTLSSSLGHPLVAPPKKITKR